MKVKLNGNDFYEVTTQFGVTDYLHQTPHTGLDLAMRIGTKLFSPTDGVVQRVVDYGNENIGKGIIIKTNDGENVIMGHLSGIKVKIGQKIHEGQLVALSGSTGNSTGGHLHLGLKDAHGTFINPDKLVASNDHLGIIPKAIGIGKGNIGAESDSGILHNISSFYKFTEDVRKEGFWHALYGESFFEVIKGFFGEFFHDLAQFVLDNGDLFFLIPAIIVMFGTFIIGKNKYTKWIIPLWFAYFVSKILDTYFFSTLK